MTYLDVLQRCEERNLDIVAFTDHNTIAGYRIMHEEVEQLELLEKLERLTDSEKEHLTEYRRLFDKLLVLPGFEFTATLGFHILGIFPEDKTAREIEHLLLNLNIPGEELDKGSSTVGASADVLTAYRIINESGGLVIAAHANSTNGVAMRGYGFGGQTKIAYTQDSNLHALEVTDLGQKGKRSTAAFFNGTKPEYPRQMHTIQGSDAHRLRFDSKNKKNLGIGDRATSVLLADVSFKALMELFQSNDFARTRPHWPTTKDEFDFVDQAREDGPTINQDFHESMTVRGGHLYEIIADVCAFANTNGGTLYIGVSGDKKKAPVGISNPSASIQQLQRELSSRISPHLQCQVDTQETRGKKAIRVLVPRGDDAPYAVDDNKIYVRSEGETGLAVRDEIVQLILRDEVKPDAEAAVQADELTDTAGVTAPRTGVEIVRHEERNGVRYYTVRDLRNGNMVKNVTESSARRLWHYAISEYSSLPEDLEKASIAWKGDLGVIKESRRWGKVRYDLAQKTKDGIRVYFGVTEDGIHSEWKQLTGNEAD